VKKKMKNGGGGFLRNPPPPFFMPWPFPYPAALHQSLEFGHYLFGVHAMHGGAKTD